MKKRKEHPVTKPVPRVIMKRTIGETWLLLETYYSMGLMKVNYLKTSR